jgi:predicted DsbA family dithiol-disulfide isomerase
VKLSEGEEKTKMVNEIAKHWNQMGENATMPIDGDLWLEDPLASSYPPSVAYKAAELQDPVKAMNFLRCMREMVFLFKKNITKWELIEPAIIEAGLDPHLPRKDLEGQGKFSLKKTSIWQNNFPSIGFLLCFLSQSKD